MRTKFRFASLAAAIILAFVLAVPAYADATNVVTIGQDLSDEQEAFIINYFGADLSRCQVIYVNNQQEREYVGSWIPLEQIGNITISSAYVQPTKSGGIQVKTANLTYVTGNMIASVLSTAGVTNCNVVAAAPFPVSGTGALTGVMIAYQVATGQQLDETKRDLAVQEFTVTQTAAESIGENEALQLVNAVKMEIIRSEVPAEDTQEIANIVDRVVSNVEQSLNAQGSTFEGNTVTVDNSVVYDNSVTYDNSIQNEYTMSNETNYIDNSTIVNNGLSDSDRQLIIDLATQIARQEYQYEDVKDTLNRVEENLSHETNISIAIDNSGDVNVDNANSVNVSADSNNNIDNSNDHAATNNADVTSTNDNANSADANSSADADSTADQEDEESILSNTNDDLIDVMYQSSTREEDIIAIDEAQEEELAENNTDLQVNLPDDASRQEDPETIDPANAAADASDLSGLYDMSLVEEYHEDAPADAPAAPEYSEPQVDTPEEPSVNEAPAVPEYPAEPVSSQEESYVPEVPVVTDYAEDPAFISEDPYGNNSDTQPYMMEEQVYYSEDPAEQEQPVAPDAMYEPFDQPEDPAYNEFQPDIPDVSYDEPGVLPVEMNPEADFDDSSVQDDSWQGPAEAVTGTLAGGWTVYQNVEEAKLPEFVQLAFDKALDGYVGMDFTPAAYLGSQVVAGTNYRILCTGSPVIPDPQTSLYVVTVYEDLEGNARITDVADVDLAKLEETTDAQIPSEILMGGWTAPSDYEEGQLPADAKAAFEDVTYGLMGVSYTPEALLGTKVIAGTEYAILAHAEPVTEEPVSYFAILYIASNVDGTNRILNIVPLDLGTFSSSVQD